MLYYYQFQIYKIDTSVELTQPIQIIPFQKTFQSATLYAEM